MRPSVQELFVSTEAPVRRALEVLDRTAQDIVFVVDADHVLQGVLTDGDIRRALLRNVSLEAPTLEVAQRAFVALPVSTPAAVVLQTLNEQIRLIPLLDERGRVIDYASFSHAHWMPVMEPSLSGNEMKYVIECITTNWISSQGRFVTDFERAFEASLGGGYALAVSNGTVALHLALATLGIGPGDEVIIPDLTFAATANAVLYTGATPVIVDVSPDTWTIDPVEIERAITTRTRAIIPVHLYGHPADMDAIERLAVPRGVAVIEDAAEAVGARYKGRPVGILGDAGCFSFFGNKILTTGEGGMVVFARERDYVRARMLRDHGMDPTRRYWHLEVGFNYRLTNLQAAVGVAQLERLDDLLAGKRRVADAYRAAIAEIPWLQPPPVAAWAESVYWLFTVLLDAAAPVSADELSVRLQHAGIETRPVFYPLHEMPLYRDCAGGRSCPVATDVARRGLSLPSSPHLSGAEVRRVVESLQRIHEVRTLWATGA
jgi:perosamine synthetase